MSRSQKNNNVNSIGYKADCTESAPLPAIIDQRFDDFDAQSEQLSGHDQEYCQLSSGRFAGRFISAFAGPELSIHCEKANQKLEQWIGCPRGIVSIGIVLEEAAGFVVNGQNLGSGDVMITRPGGEMNLSSPANGAIMAICIEETLLTEMINEGAAASILHPNREAVETIHSAALARHLRTDALSVLQTLRNHSCSPPQRGGLSRPFVNAITAQFSLHAALAGDANCRAGKLSRTEFMRAKRLIADGDMDQVDYERLCERTSWSKRSIQSAFARYANISPSRYLRAIKLNRTRRALLDHTNTDTSIGDIAAANGFWNWSRFTHEYKALFCELPSQTRSRAH